MVRTTLAVLLLTAPAHGEAPRGCPAAVTTGVLKVFPRATIRSCKAEHEHGKDMFEVKVTKANGDPSELDVAPSGDVAQIEETIAIDALPDAVKQAFAARYPKARTTGAEQQTAGKQVRYEIAFQTGSRRREATFAADGTFVEQE